MEIMKITEIQKLMLEEMLTWGEYYYGYWRFDIYIDKKAIKKPVLQKEMKGLRELGLVDFVRGLIDDEGMACGSGYNIEYSKREEIEELIKT